MRTSIYWDDLCFLGQLQHYQLHGVQLVWKWHQHFLNDIVFWTDVTEPWGLA